MKNIKFKSYFLSKKLNDTSNLLNIDNETISSTKTLNRINYNNYNGNTYFHLLSSDEFHLICKYIPDQETRINLMILFYYGHKQSTYYRLINKPLRRLTL